MARQRYFFWALGSLLLTMEPAFAVLPQFEQPGWSALTAEQKRVLAPLEDDWPAMDPFRRKKWLGIASRYADMAPTEQTSIQRNMREWSQLHPVQRKFARQKFIALQKTPPEQRQTVKLKWEEYQALTHEEREQLRQLAPTNPTPPKTPTKPPTSTSPADSAISKVRPVVKTSKSPLSPLKPTPGFSTPPSTPQPNPASPRLDRKP